MEMKSNRKIKVCQVTSFLNYSLFIEAIGGFLDKSKYDVSFVFLNAEASPLEKLLSDQGFCTKVIRYRGRRDLPAATLKLRKILKEIQPDIVHTHLVDASLAGLFASKLSGIKNRLHTRHHGTECHTYYPHAVYYDKIVNSLSGRIIATTGIVRETLVEREGADENKISVIPYGYDLTKFESDVRVTSDIREKYGLRENYPVVGVISRFIELKGIQYIIPAFARLAKEYPKAKLVLANAVGSYSSVLDEMLERELKPDQFIKIEFETKIFDLYKNFDIFLHVPITRDTEAFGQTYIEALYSEIPSVFTLSGIAHDIIRDGENAIVVPYCDAEAIYDGMKRLLYDEDLRAGIVKDSKEAVLKTFGGAALAAELDTLYSEMLGRHS
jgi:glycosyltransferase involved in cell wall biosynthesis